MKTYLTAAVLLASATSVASAGLLYEPFDYPTGTNIDGMGPNAGQTWALNGNATASPIVTTAPGMSVPGLSPGGVGNAVHYTPTGDTLRININSDETGIAAGSVFYSLMLQVNDLGSTPTNNGTGSFIGGLNNLTGTQATVPSVVGGKLRMQQITGNGTDYVLGTQANGGASAFDSTVFHPGDQVFAVVEYNIDTKVSQLWVNPNPADYGAASAPAASATSGVGNVINLGIASFVLRMNSVAPDTTIDELRVGTSWADVTSVPEPASLSLVGVAAAGLLSRRRARRA